MRMHSLFVDTEGRTGPTRTPVEIALHADDVRAQGAYESTALHMAATLGHVETVRILVKMGGDAFAQDADWNTPLLCAAAAGHAETVQGDGGTGN
jgi:ankyrin repeat protein